MSKIKIYTPVIGPKDGNGEWGTLPAAQSEDPNEAERKAVDLNALVRAGSYEVKRLDEHFIYSDDKRPI